MNVEALTRAFRETRVDGCSVARWSIHGVEARRLSLGVKDRETGNAHAPLGVSESAGARYLIVWSDGQVSRGHLERRQVEAEPREAVRIARSAAYRDDDAAQVAGPAAMPDVALHDAGSAAIAEGDWGLLAERLDWLRPAIERHGARTWSGSLAAGVATSRIETSEGLVAEERASSFGWHVTLDGEVGDGFSGRRVDDEDAFRERFERLAAVHSELAREAAAGDDGDVVPVLLHPHVVESFVLGTLLHNLDGATVEHDEGHFRAADFGSGRPVLRADVGLRLDPLAPFRSGSYRFTTEGIPAAPCRYLEAGCLVEPLLDLKYARRLGRRPTPLPYARDALHLEARESLAWEDGLRAVDGGALVLSVLGTHTQDPASGDFSLSATHALRVRGDGFAGRLRATLSGNVFEALADPRLALVRFPLEHTPGLVFPCRLAVR